MAKNNEDHSGRKFMLGAVLGAAAGAIAALLTAPKSGKETREDIKNKATELSQDALRQLRKLEGELSKKISDVKKLAQRLEGEAKKEVEALVDRAEKLKDHALKMIEDFKSDARKKADKKFVEEIETAIRELEGLKERLATKK